MIDLPPPPAPPIPPPGWTPPRRRLSRTWRKRIAIGIAIWMGLSLIAYVIDPPDEDDPSGHRPAVEVGPVTATL